MESAGSGKGPVADSLWQPSYATKGGAFLDDLSCCWFLQKDRSIQLRG